MLQPPKVDKVPYVHNHKLLSDNNHSRFITPQFQNQTANNQRKGEQNEKLTETAVINCQRMVIEID